MRSSNKLALVSTLAIAVITYSKSNTSTPAIVQQARLNSKSMRKPKNHTVAGAGVAQTTLIKV